MKNITINKILNIKDFSEIAGVSVATVSRVFSGKQTVTKKTRDKILNLADQYGFRPSQVAKSSFGGKTKSIGVLLCRLSCSYFADIAIGIQRELLKEDYLPIIIDLREDGERAGLKRLIDHRVDGVILSIADQTLTEAELKEINRFGLPVVTVDTPGFSLSYDNVCSDDRNGGRLAGEYLIKNNHRKINFISYELKGSYTTLNRLTGLREALAEEGLVIKQSDIVELSRESSKEEASIDLIAQHLSSESAPTAVYTYNDTIALMVYRAAAKAGLRIPEDLSVIGHADLDFTTAMSPELTTIKQDGIAIGQTAAQMMLERLGAYTGEARRNDQPVELVIRNSVRTI